MARGYVKPTRWERVRDPLRIGLFFLGICGLAVVVYYLIVDTEVVDFRGHIVDCGSVIGPATNATNPTLCAAAVSDTPLWIAGGGALAALCAAGIVIVTRITSKGTSENVAAYVPRLGQSTRRAALGRVTEPPRVNRRQP